MRKILKKRILKFLVPGIIAVAMMVNMFAFTGLTLPDGSPFDPDYYRTTYNLTGSDEELANHYWYYGIPEGKLPYSGMTDVSAATLLNSINEYRVANGLTPYTFDAQLQEYAQLRARELADTSFFAHTRPDGSAWKTTFGDNYTNYRRLGENLARGQSSSVIVVARWQKSATHNAVMLDTKCNIAGVGVAKSADGMFYFCLIVGLSK